MTDTAAMQDQEPDYSRERLPNRRQCDCVTFAHGEAKGIATFSRYGHPLEPGRVAEIFVDIGRPGSDYRAGIQAAAVATSIALQFGAPLDTIRHALPRLDDGTAAEPLGSALDAIARVTEEEQKYLVDGADLCTAKHQSGNTQEAITAQT